MYATYPVFYTYMHVWVCEEEELEEEEQKEEQEKKL